MNMTILFPVMLVVVVGLIFGIILTIAAKFMFVPVDEIVAKVREELPGANCGACGYAGCDDYAGAFGDDKDTPVNKCPVGGPDLAAKIAEILGVEASSGAEPVAVVLCQGTNSVATDMMKYGSDMTCKGASQLFGGSKSCSFGCLGLGDCVAACDFDSIGIVDGIAFVDRETCVGCGACAKACPKSIIDMVTKDDRVVVKCKSKDKGAQVMKSCKTGCIGCKKCETACPFDSIHVTDNLAQINYETCKNCGLCAKACPTHAIHMTPKKKPVVQKPAPKVESTEATA